MACIFYRSLARKAQKKEEKRIQSLERGCIKATEKSDEENVLNDPT